MRTPTIKIEEKANRYSNLRTRALSVIISMTDNSNFPTPSPSIPELQAANDALSDAITAWGKPGNRGSQLDLSRLRTAANNMRNLLIQEAGYIVNLVDKNTSVEEQTAFILSSGFAIRNPGKPQGALEAPQNLRQLIRANISIYKPKMKWEKPLGLNNRANVKYYKVYRGTSPNFSEATLIAESTKTVFHDMNAPRGTTQFYFVTGVNAAGEGINTLGVEVHIPN